MKHAIPTQWLCCFGRSLTLIKVIKLVSIIAFGYETILCHTADYGLSTFERREMEYSLLIYIGYIFTYCYYYAWGDLKGALAYGTVIENAKSFEIKMRENVKI